MLTTSPEPHTQLPAEWGPDDLAPMCALLEQRLVVIQHQQREAIHHPPVDLEALACSYREVEWLQGLLLDSWARLRDGH